MSTKIRLGGGYNSRFLASCRDTKAKGGLSSQSIKPNKTFRAICARLFSFLLTFVVASILTPVSKGSALTCENGTISGGSASSICDTSTTDVNVSITGAWTVSVSSAGTLGLNLTPTSSGVLSTATDNVNVYT
ncbi:hypothetical protein IJI55_01030, partial [Candidatus Saccharibacteria bacterium]|nr:hypothetical protein [Candidatus Saccharibacteria bacterium]